MNDVLLPFLKGAGFADWRREDIPADASPRRYARLIGPRDESVILLRTDTARDDSLTRMLDLAAYLAGAGVSAPLVIASAPEQGLAILSDLGRSDLTDPDVPQDEAHDAVTELLIHLAHCDPPELPHLTPEIGGDMVRIAALDYAGGTADDADRLAAEMTAAMQRYLGPPDRLALRDVHAENLIWRPGRQGLDRIGVLDFQDAFLAPVGYDLASYLCDVRRDIPDPPIARAIGRFSAALNLDRKTFERQFHLLAAQRNLRILGVFARLIRGDGKDKYRAFLPRTRRLLDASLAHPDFADLRAVVSDVLPMPDEVSL